VERTAMSVAPRSALQIVASTRQLPKLSWRDRAGEHQHILRGRVVVGAAAAANLVIEDVTVSRIHVELEPRDEGTWIHDLASRNGTTVNDASIKETIVGHGGIVRVGNTAIRIDYDNALEVPVELWAGEEFHGLVGRSKVMRELFALITRLAPTNSSILIQGETGTGKELVARSIHEASLRSNSPFVVVDCAALPENLLDTELFGHAKGAFTGAVQSRAGAIESADGGTVFLDEIGELPITMQPKLLRVLEQRTVRRIGESTHRPVNVRFVSATHRDLLSMVSRGEFREDLYFRLCVLPLRVPPLRERKEDLELLVRRFSDVDLSASFVAGIARQAWRGNVRELRNFVERARALGETSAHKHELFPRSNPFDEEEAPTSSPRLHQTMPPTMLVDADDEEERRSPSAVPMLPPLSTWLPTLPVLLPLEDSARSLLPPPSTQQSETFSGDYKAFRERWIEEGERRYLQTMMQRHNNKIAAVAHEAGVARTYIYRLVKKHGL
jgi:transcriptional regulator with GAF, ATPase, and Fis domain